MYYEYLSRFPRCCNHCAVFKLIVGYFLSPGFSTAKGELVRSILFPKPVDFKFSQDGIKFMGFLAIIAVMGMIYTLILMVSFLFWVKTVYVGSFFFIMLSHVLSHCEDWK
jgi:magnesium-transporting ATPase (P-type)